MSDNKSAIGPPNEGADVNQEAEAKVIASELKIDPTAEPPKEKLQGLRDRNGNFGKLWEQAAAPTKPIPETALAQFMLSGSWSVQEVADSLVAHRRELGFPAQGVEHYADVIAKAVSYNESFKAGKKRAKTSEGTQISKSEQRGELYFRALLDFIGAHNGQFLQDENGGLHSILSGRRIPLNYERDNYALAELMLKLCGVSTHPPEARAAIQRLQVHAKGRAGRLRLRRFSPLSEDAKRLYVSPCRSASCCGSQRRESTRYRMVRTKTPFG